MQALLPTDAPAVKLSVPARSPLDHSLKSPVLQQLGERLRVTYGPMDAPLPARLAELIETMERREHARD